MTEVDIKDFSYERDFIEFRVGEDVFRAAPDIPAEAAMDFADKSDQLERDDLPVEERKQIMHELFNMLLFPESAERFIARMSSTEAPIGTGRVTQIIQWLFGEYGMRPTQPSEDYSDGSPATPESGTNSTENTPAVGSTSDDSALIDS